MQKNEGKFWRTNDKIKFSPVLLIDSEGNNLGVVKLEEAKIKARILGLDLVEISPNARPPVCKIIDFGKFKYEQKLKEKQQKQTCKKTQLKEIRLSPRIEEHDVQIKVNAAKKFIKEGHKVMFKLKFMHREKAHKDVGVEIINKIISNLAEDADHQAPKMDGNILACVFSPKIK